MSYQKYDAVIVGAGVIGAIVAKVLTEAGKKVLILEAGRNMPMGLNDYRAYEVYRSYVDHYQTQVIKIPNSPYPPNPSAPSPYATDNIAASKKTPDAVGYWVQNGPQPFMSSYLRQMGGTTLHWMGSAMRSLPNDFRMKEEYGVGRDWPVTYDDLRRYYRMAEWEMGVSADKKDQEYYGITFEDGYDYPMRGLPASWLDRVLSEKTKGLKVPMGGEEKEIFWGNLPVSRNSIPREFPDAPPRNPDEPTPEPPWRDYQPVGAVGAPHLGQRCEGNSSCTPICPVQAKYNALKTLARLDPKLCRIESQAVATTLAVGEDGRVTVLKYKTYDTEGGGPVTEKTVSARIFVLAAHAVENAKIILASRREGQKIGEDGDQVGRNLMDHPYFMTWGLAPMSVGAFRGPGYTSGIPVFRDGIFRRDSAAFRLDVGNWGWNFSEGAPASDVTNLLSQNVVGRQLRDTLGRTVPRQIRFGFQIEQLPSDRNRVKIKERYKDALGNYRPVIEYEVDDYTYGAMANAVRISNAIFDRVGVPEGQRFTLNNPGLPTYREFEGQGFAFFGAGHLAGTHRMGNPGDGSVVDTDQRFHGHDNLYLVGCGSFPTIATANPTLTAAALAYKSAEAMVKRLS